MEKKLSSWKNIPNYFVQSLLSGIFPFFFTKNRLYLDDFWSIIFLFVWPIRRFLANFVILLKISNF